MIQDQRVIYNTLDISNKVNDFRSGAGAFAYVTGSYLYVGAPMPFNNLWFEFGAANVISSTPTVEIWFGNAWVPAVDILDETVGMTSNGRLTWNTDRLKGWGHEQTSEDVTGMSSFKIYWKFWLRLSWSQNFTGGTTLKFMGQRFSVDDTLFSFYPDLAHADMLTGFETGKTTWDEQHYMAAEHIVRDLKSRSIIRSSGQIMDWQQFERASCHKVAEIVYTAFGRPYFDQLAEARKQYKEAMNVKLFDVDQNANGSLEPVERSVSTSFMKR